MWTSCSECERPPLCLCLLLPHSEEFGQNIFDILHPKLWGRVSWEGRVTCTCKLLLPDWAGKKCFGWFVNISASFCAIWAISTNERFEYIPINQPLVSFEEYDWDWQNSEFSQLSSTRNDLTTDDRQNQMSFQFISTKLFTKTYYS